MATAHEKLSIIQWIMETEDEAIIAEINAIRNDHIALAKEQKEVLNHRLKRYTEGNMEFSLWKDVKARIMGVNV